MWVASAVSDNAASDTIQSTGRPNAEWAKPFPSPRESSQPRSPTWTEFSTSWAWEAQGDPAEREEPAQLAWKAAMPKHPRFNSTNMMDTIFTLKKEEQIEAPLTSRADYVEEGL